MTNYKAYIYWFNKEGELAELPYDWQLPHDVSIEINNYGHVLKFDDLVNFFCQAHEDRLQQYTLVFDIPYTKQAKLVKSYGN